MVPAFYYSDPSDIAMMPIVSALYFEKSPEHCRGCPGNSFHRLLFTYVR